MTLKAKATLFFSRFKLPVHRRSKIEFCIKIILLESLQLIANLPGRVLLSWITKLTVLMKGAGLYCVHYTAFYKVELNHEVKRNGHVWHIPYGSLLFSHWLKIYSWTVHHLISSLILGHQEQSFLVTCCSECRWNLHFQQKNEQKCFLLNTPSSF